MNIKKLSRHTNRVTVRFTDEMYAKLKKDAKRAGVSVSEVVRQCVEYNVTYVCKTHAESMAQL